MIERLGENDRVVTRYVSDESFQGAAFPILAREIFEAVRAGRPSAEAPVGRADAGVPGP